MPIALRVALVAPIVTVMVACTPRPVPEPAPDVPPAAVDAGPDAAAEAQDETVAEAAAPPAAEEDCLLDLDALSPLLAPAEAGPTPTVVQEGHFLVETVALDDEITLQVRQGGCAHYAAVFIFTPVEAAGGAEAVALAHGLLSRTPLADAPGGGAGHLLVARLGDAAAASETFVDCGDATCSVEPGELDGTPALLVRYDLAL